MIKKIASIAGLLFVFYSASPLAQQRAIALTIDDLPFVGESKNFHLNLIIDAIKSHNIPATGFIIAKQVRHENWAMLQKFKDAGLSLGNHTLTHANLNTMSANTYIQDIETADKILSPVLTKPKYFRYPYLVMGEGHKKTTIMEYLSSKHYQIAPITIDSKDFVFNQLLLTVVEKQRRHFLNALKQCYLDFIWQQTLKAEAYNRSIKKPNQAQILLIHANLLNAYVLPDIIALYKQNGFQFVSLTEALQTIDTPDKHLAHTKKETVDLDEDVVWD